MKQVKRLIGFVQLFRNFIPNLGDKLLPFYHLLRKDKIFTITDDHYKDLKLLKADLNLATNLTLRLPKHGLQHVIHCDASFHGTGFVLMIEDYLIDQIGKQQKNAPVSFMQIDPSLSLRIKLIDRVPVRKIEIETAAKPPDASLSSIDSVHNFLENTIEPIDAQFIEQLQKRGLYAILSKSI